jgi:hypothetical protein
MAPAVALTAQETGANPADVESIDGIITALYGSISGPVGQERDFERFKSIFAPDARLQPTSSQAPNGYVSLTTDEFWAQSRGTFESLGFTEYEIGRTTEVFGNVTHAFSTYESYRYDQGEPDGPFSRGINSIQIIHHQNRYWVLSITWDSEGPDKPIPAKYIGG